MPVKLVEGGYYLRRDGKVVGPLGRIHGLEYPVFSAYGFLYYGRLNGNRFRSVTSSVDLVAEAYPPKPFDLESTLWV